ncbi:hypothetical protein ZHAS_00005396 [Anopheles sinensis]|uniref:Uncharacterized protein n=1 Tax=Anopheles sinensis TaxID=74873 RepID=A0A084VJD1_ANOSI|nr:hypothetical protein ZHAS_00005396 [Anopheles sinensis]
MEPCEPKCVHLNLCCQSAISKPPHSPISFHEHTLARVQWARAKWGNDVWRKHMLDLPGSQLHKQGKNKMGKRYLRGCR